MAKAKSKTAPVKLATVGIVAILHATDSAEKCAVVPEAEAQELFAKGFIEVAPDNSEAGEGNVFARITQQGRDYVSTLESVGNAEVESTVVTGKDETAKVEFDVELEDSMPIPVITGRGGGKKSKYPFDSMNVGQSFFVPLAGEKLASTVSAANARYAIATGETKVNGKGKTVPVKHKTREFVMRSVRENYKGEMTNGTRIWRKA